MLWAFRQAYMLYLCRNWTATCFVAIKIKALEARNPDKNVTTTTFLLLFVLFCTSEHRLCRFGDGSLTLEALDTFYCNVYALNANWHQPHADAVLWRLMKIFFYILHRINEHDLLETFILIPFVFGKLYVATRVLDVNVWIAFNQPLI